MHAAMLRIFVFALLSASVSGFALHRHPGNLASRWVRLCAETKTVVLTREDGKNGKLATLLAAEGIQSVEVPCITHGIGVDRPQLPARLHDTADWSFVVVTSPEAAEVLLEGWAVAGKPAGLRIASIGAATSVVLKEGGLIPSFEPSKATAATMVVELPFPPSPPKGQAAPTVLYPASALAADTLESGLTARGFQVTTVNTQKIVDFKE